MKFKEYSFKDLLVHIVDNRGRTCPTTEGGIPLIATNCIKNNRLYPAYEKIRYVSKETYQSWFRGHPKPNDIIFVCKGSPGQVCWVPDPIQFCIAQDMVAIRADESKVYPKYLFALLRSDIIQHKILNMHVGTLIPHFKKGDFSNLYLQIPEDMDHQKKVGDSYFSFCEKIESNHQINQTLEQMAQAIFKSWFVDFEPVKAKIAALEAGGSEEDALQAAMQAIAGKSADDLAHMQSASPEQYAELRTTAELFPSAMQDSELGEIPEGWEVQQIGETLDRLKPKKRYTKKQVFPTGQTPVFEQGADILLGFHNDSPGFIANPEDPAFIFGDHTCIIHLSCQNFDISQNVIPLKGKSRPTIWTYYALQGKQTFQEYRRHWAELVVKPVIYPPHAVCKKFSETTNNSIRLKEQLDQEAKNLSETRDILLPKLLSGHLILTTIKGGQV